MSKFLIAPIVLLLVFAPLARAQTPTFNSLEELEAAVGYDLPDDFDYQNFDPPPNFFERGQTELPNTINCFDYYTFGSVAIDIFNAADSAVAGIPATFQTKIKNNNPYPLVDGGLYIKIFRAQSDIADTTVHGDHIVDEFYVLSDVTLAAGEEKTHAFSWTPPVNLPAGKYYAAAYYNTAESFNLAGLPFTDDIIGGRGDFTLVSDAPALYFEKDSVMVDGKAHQFIAAPPQVTPDAPVVVSTTIKNDAAEDRVVMVTWNIYSWDALPAENRIDTVEEAVLVPARGTATVSYTLNENRYAVYLVSPKLRYNNESLSELDIRFVRPTKDHLRINFPSLHSFPLQSGKEATLFSCLHNGGTAAVVPGSTLALTLTDDHNNVLHSYRYNGPTSGAMMGVASVFTPARNYDHVTLTAELTHNGAIVDSVSVEYDCKVIDDALCFEDEASDSAVGDASPVWKYTFYAVLFFVFVSIAIVVVRIVRLGRTRITPDEPEITNQNHY